MDGSEVTVVVLGQRGVGKTTFIARALGLPFQVVPPIMREAVNICGRTILVKLVDNPSRHQLVPAIVVIVLFDLTNKDTFHQLNDTLELAQRVSPTALRAVVGTKADLHEQRRVSSSEAVSFCQTHHNSSSSNFLPYYETALTPNDSIFIAFQEILARPLINEFVIRATTEQELLVFVHEMMDWAIQSSSANVLTHLRDLGYSVPVELVERNQDVMRDYFFSEYPLQVVPKFAHLELSELPDESLDDFSLEAYEEAFNVFDTRSSLEIAKAYHLMWQDISLTCFSRSFLDYNVIPVHQIAHVNLSYNKLTSIPALFFHLPSLESLDVSHNQLEALPSIETWSTASKLQILNASHNAITGESLTPLLLRKQPGKQVPFRDLWYVNLSHNQLCSFPQWVLRLQSLKHLNIGYNPKIRKLPIQLCHMEKQLTVLILSGLSLIDPPPVVVRWGPRSLLRYLTLKKSSAVTWNGLRVVVVGPKESGKTSLLNRLRTDAFVSPPPTKGLEIMEWKYRGAELFTFRQKWCTVDFWDFTGDPEYRCIYSCFGCGSSPHLVVCDSQREWSGLIRWLSDIQATSVERIPVIVIFTQIDRFKSREQRDQFKRRATHWLEYNNKQCDSSTGALSLLTSVTESVKSLQGDEMVSSYDPPQEAFELQELAGDTIPLMPLVLKVHFVSSVTGEGITNLRKNLYRMASGTLLQNVTTFSGFHIIGQEIPTAYAQVEHLIRQLRQKFRNSKREGEQRPFYTALELMEKLKKHLRELKIGEEVFMAALKFMHECGFVYLHECHKSDALLVSVDPQVVGYLLQRMIRAGAVGKEVNSLTCHLPNSHLFMLWGVEPIWSADRDRNTIYSHHLIDFLYGLNICTSLVPTVTTIPSILPPSLPDDQKLPELSSLTPRRVYILGYLPTLFSSQLVTRILSAIGDRNSSRPPSPSLLQQSYSSPAISVPIELASGAKLFLWHNNVFLEETDGAKLWVRILEGKQVGPESLPYCGRVDIAIEAGVEREAEWLGKVTQEIDYLLEHTYPTLLESEQCPQQVEIFVPLSSSLCGGETTSLPLYPPEDVTATFSDSPDRPTLSNPGNPLATRYPSTPTILSIPPDTSELSNPTNPSDHSTPTNPSDHSTPTNPSDHSTPTNPSELSNPTNPSDHSTPTNPSELSNPMNPSDLSTPTIPSELSNSTNPSDHSTPTNPSDLSTPTNPSDLSTPTNLSNPSTPTNPSTPSTPPPNAPSTSTPPHPLNPHPQSQPVPLTQPTQQQQLAMNGTPSSSGQAFLRHTNPGHSILSNQLIVGSPADSEHQSDASSWEILSKQSSTASARLNMIQDCTTNYCLIPLWECIQEAFKAPVIRVNSNKLFLRQMIPDLLFVDLPPELIYRSKSSMGDQLLFSLEDSLVPPMREVSGLFVRSYYSSEIEDTCVRKPAGAQKTFCLRQCLTNARRDLLKLRELQCPFLVVAIGLNFCPPSLALESAPMGSLHSLLQSRVEEVDRKVVHYILLQLLSALEFFHSRGLNYHTMDSSSVLIWTLNPVTVKLSDYGFTHSGDGCELCVYLESLHNKEEVWATACRFDYMLLGLLVYEMASGKQPYEDVYSPNMVVLALLDKKVELNIEAEIRTSPKWERKEVRICGCQRLCMQSALEQCINSNPVLPNLLGARFSVCAGDREWSPMRLTVNVECMLCSEEADLIYWASGSRGLVTGTLDPNTGILISNILQEAPTPESGMFANRRAKPVPIAVGRATVLDLCQATQQLWVGTENGLVGSVYVFNLPEMRRHHYIHLQDAVLSLCAVNELGAKFGGDNMKYRILVGLANGTIILFLGMHQGKVLENPLQGPKLVVVTQGRKPCLGMTLTPDGYIWCSCGDALEVLDIVSLKSVRRLSTQVSHGEDKSKTLVKGDVITLIVVNSRGVWTVSRRSPVLRLWNQVSGQLKASYNIRNILPNDDVVTALAVQGGVVWLGTRNGFIFVLDGSAMDEGKDPLLGLQYCGEGKVKSVIPITPKRRVTAKLQVMCSLEFPDEVSGALMTWEFYTHQGWNPRVSPKPSRTTSVTPPVLIPPPSHSPEPCKSI